MGASNLDYEYVGDYHRIKLMWDRPEINEGLSGYYLYRRRGEEGEYARIKLLGSSATSYTDNTANEEGVYYYRLYAYYREIDCTSAPATAKDNPNQFYLSAYYSLDDVAEQEMPTIDIFPNPADQSLNIEVEGLEQVVMYNMMGQVVYQHRCSDNVVNINTSNMPAGIYNLSINTAQGAVTKRFAVVH